MSAGSALDWAKLDLQRFETVANLQLKAMQVQAEYALKMMEVLEKRVKIEQDIVRLKVLKDALASYKKVRHSLEAKIRAHERRATTVNAHANWLRKIGTGQHLPQNVVVHVWSAFYFFVQNVPEPAIDVPSDARLAMNFTREFDVPETETTPWGYVLFVRSKNMMPKTSTQAMKFLYQVVDAMCISAEDLITEAEAEAAALQTKLDKMQDDEWKTLFDDG